MSRRGTVPLRLTRQASYFFAFLAAKEAEVPSMAAATSSQPTPSSATVPSAASPTSLAACVKGWTNANHRETVKAGVDDAITMTQVDEWEEWCKDGKQASAAGN